MSFIKVNINEEIAQRKDESPSFARTWFEHNLVNEMVSLRKDKKIPQTELAKITESRQQIISRIERKESSPTLGLFCILLDALGYEIKIVKKSD